MSDQNKVTEAKARLCRAESLIAFKEARINGEDKNPNVLPLSDSAKHHWKQEVQAIKYLMVKAKEQLDAEGIDYSGYENFGRELQDSRSTQ